MSDMLSTERPLPIQPSGQKSGLVDSGAIDPIIHSWSGPQIRELIRSPDLRRLYERWMTLIGNKLPRLNEILADHNGAFHETMLLLLPVPNDFAFMYQGPAAMKMIGVNLVGTLLSERKTAIAQGIHKACTNCISVSEPFYIRHVASHSTNQHFFLEQIALPLAADERRDVNFVLLYNAPLDDKSEVLKAIFDRSQIGMIAAASNYDESGKLNDGHILLMNEQARTILKLPHSMNKVQTVHDLGAWFRDGAMWTKTSVVPNGKQTHVHYRDRSDANYRVTIEPIDRYVLFSIVEMPNVA